MSVEDNGDAVSAQPDDNPIVESAVKIDEGASLTDVLNTAMVLMNQGNLEQAVQVCREAIRTFPNQAEPYFVLSVIAYRIGNRAQALEMAETAHELDPDTREYAQLLSSILTRLGRVTDGVYYAKIATINEPHPYISTVMPPHFIEFDDAADDIRPSVHGVEAMRLYNVANYEAARREALDEVRINNDNLAAYEVLARATLACGRYTQASGAAQAAIRLDPEKPLSYALLARALLHLGRYDEAASVARTALALDPVDAEVFAPVMYVLSRCPNADPEALKAFAREFNAAFEEDNDLTDKVVQVVEDGRPPHIGYLSNAFFRCRMGETLSAWIRGARRKGILLSGFQQSVAKDGVTTLLRDGSDRWREVFNLDPYTLSVTLESEQVEVLVDASDIEGETRLTVNGMRIAPVRVGVSALPEPGLAPGITHVLSDESLQHADRGMLLDGQELIVVAGSLFARDPYQSLAQDSAVPSAATGIVTFGAMASLPEVSVDCVMSWARILRAVPGARLMLFDDGTLSEERRTRIREYLLHAGIVEYVLFASHGDSDEEPTGIDDFKPVLSSAHWREIDIFLDTFPVNCAAVQREALWSGVPTVTCRNDRRVGNVGASVVAAAGHAEWIADDPAAYEDIAVGLAQDADGLAEARAGLQKNVANSPLFKPAQTAESIRGSLVKAAVERRIKPA